MMVFGIFFEQGFPPGQESPSQSPNQGEPDQVPNQGALPNQGASSPPAQFNPQLGQLPSGVPPPELNPEKIGAEDSPEMEPLKKFYLVQRLQDLKIKLLQSGITNDDLETVLKFGESFSYNVLLNLSNSLLKSVDKEIKSYAKIMSQEAKRVAVAARRVQAESKKEKTKEIPEDNILTPNESVPFSS